MPGLAVFVNKAVPDAKSLQLFYNTQELNLGLKLKDGSANPEDNTKALSATNKNRTGIIVNGTSVGAAEYLGTSVVAALTQPALLEGQKEYTKYDVSIVSPVYMPLSITEKDNTAIAMASSGQAAWVYYISGTDANSLTLHEFVLGSPAVTPISNTTKILYGSELASYYDPLSKYRYVFYQEADDQERLFEYCVNTKTPLPVNNSDNSKGKTTIAVTVAGTSTYLYYLGKGNVIYRIVKDKDGWGTSKIVQGVQKCDENSDLTVTTANNVNHLFYQPKDAATYEFAHCVDTL